MESVLIFLVALGIFILLLVIRNEFLKKYEILNKNLFAIHKEVKNLQQKELPLAKSTAMKFTSLADTPIKDNSLDLSSQRPIVEIQPEKKGQPLFKEVEKKVEEPKNLGTETQSEKKIIVSPVAASTPEIKKESAASKQTVQTDSSKSSLDLEKRIGENWLNKIGIGILVIGIGFFVKYAIDKNWIGELGRLGIGIGAAFILIGLAHWLRKKYHAFSSVLIGGGIATLYYTISIGYHDYGLFSQPVAFGIMTAITLFATLMAVWYDRRELAIIGLIGGFTAPFMVAGETNNAAVFFTYIAILNSGMLLLSFFKKWVELNRMAFAFTSLYLLTWIFMNQLDVPKNATIAITFLIIFFVQFLTMNLIYNIIKKVKFNSWEFIHLLSISALFYGSILYALQASGHGELKGIFTTSLTALFAVLTLFLKRLPGTENSLLFLLSGKAVTFLTLTIFIQFNGHLTTLFWAIEAIVLYWIGMKSKMNLLKNTSLIVIGISTISLFVVWSKNYQLSDTLLPAITNVAFATGCFVLLCYGGLIYFLRRDSEEKNILGIGANYFSIILQYWSFIALYLVLLLEAVHQSQRIFNNEAELIVICLYNLIYFTTGAILANWKGNQMAQKLFFGFGALCMLLYVAFGNMTIQQVRDNLFSGSGLNLYYQLHYFMPVLFVILIFVMYKMLLKFSSDLKHVHAFTILTSLFGLYLICAEMDHLAVYKFAATVNEKSVVLKHTQIAGYTIVWGCYSFLMMILGMRKKARAIRIFALIAFSITLFKLFAFDIRNISEGGKIVAFILLGVMLLVVSFLYQKLKKMIVDGAVGSQE